MAEVNGKIVSDRKHHHTVYCADCLATAKHNGQNQATVGKVFRANGWKKTGKPQKWRCPSCNGHGLD